MYLITELQNAWAKSDSCLGDIVASTITIFFTHLSVINRTDRISLTNVGDWNNIIKELDRVAIYKMLPTTIENVYIKCSQIDHVLGYKTNLKYV